MGGWKDIDDWGRRDPDTGAFLALPDPHLLHAQDSGVMLAEPVGRLPGEDLFVVDVLVRCRWTEKVAFDAGDRLLVVVSEHVFDVEGDPAALASPVALRRSRGVRVVGRWTAPDGKQPKTAALIDSRTQATASAQPPMPTNVPKPVNGEIKRRPETSRWVMLICCHCGCETPMSSAAFSERLADERATWKTWSLSTRVSCASCGTVHATVSERIPEQEDRGLAARDGDG